MKNNSFLIIIIRLKQVLLLASYCLLRIKAMLTKPNSTKNVVLIDLTGLCVNRRIVQVVLQLKLSGYEICYTMSAKLFVRTKLNGFADYQQLFFDNARYYRKSDIYLVTFCGKTNNRAYKKKIVFDDNILSFKDVYYNDFYFPILFHPNALAINREKTLESFCKTNKIGMLFIGNNDASYSRAIDKLHNSYCIETRNEVIDYLLEYYKEYIIRPDSKEQFFSLLNDYHESLKNKIVICDRFRLFGDDYWLALKNSAFFIWTSGVVQPYCHNQVESMSCGAIPIYNKSIYYPGLNDTNSYSYSDLNGFGVIVEKLLKVDISNEIITEKNNLIKRVFFDNLSINAFSKKMRSFLEEDKKEETYYICHSIYSE